MLPLSFKNYVPELLKRKVDFDDGAIALINKIDEHLEEWKKELIDFRYLSSPERATERILNEFGYMLSADLWDFDSKTVKMQKVETATQRNAYHGVWENSIKLIIDYFCGGDSSIIEDYYTGDWIIWGQESSDPSDYTGTMGTDGLDDDLGLDLAGYGEYGAGVIRIDVDNNALTASEVNQLVEILDSTYTPAYMKVIIGYMSGSMFVEYATMG